MAETETVPILRIFVSSPNDVAEERVVALAVVRRLQAHFQGRLRLVPILWEHEPLLATAGFQEEIDRRAPPSSTDIAVFILWSRLGTALGEKFTLEDGRRPGGTEWEFLDAARSSRANSLPHMLVYRKSAEVILRRGSDSQTIALEREAQFDELSKFFARYFRDAESLAFTGSYHPFSDASTFGQLLDTHLRRLLGERLQGATKAGQVTWQNAPFRGLEAFDVEHAPIFFGRTRAIHEIRNLLAKQARAGRAFVLILGASGSGKSSLARAGLIPLLAGPWVIEEGVNGGFCRRAIMRPGDAASPLGALAAALLAPEALPELAAGGGVSGLAAALSDGPNAALTLIRGALQLESERIQRIQHLAAAPPARLVLLVDQLEELFTRTSVSDLERDMFARVMEALARSGDVWVLATMRSDFYPSFARVAPLMSLKEGDGQYDLLNPGPAEIAQVIRAPALAAGLSFELHPEDGRALDDQLIEEAAQSRDSLPLLEFLLTQLWEEREGTTLTFAAHQRVGGISGAIGRHAEAIWSALDAGSRAALPALVRALVEAGPSGGSVATARRAAYAELVGTPAERGLLEALVGARLLVVRGSGETASVSVAHEALLRSWPRIADQIALEAQQLRLRAWLRGRTLEWQQRGGRGALLATDEEVRDARGLVEAGVALSQAERDFLASSQSHRTRRARLARGAMALVAGLAIVAGVLAVQARSSAQGALASAREANLARDAAGRERAVALASALAFESADVLSADPGLALLLAREAVRRESTYAGATALHAALLETSVQLRPGPLLPHDVSEVFVSPDGSRMVTGEAGGRQRLYAIQHGVVREIAIEGRREAPYSASVRFSQDSAFALIESMDAIALLHRDGREVTVREWDDLPSMRAYLDPGGFLALWGVHGLEVVRLDAPLTPVATLNLARSLDVVEVACRYPEFLLHRNDGSVEVVNLHTGASVRRIPAESAHFGQHPSNDRQFLSVSSDGQAASWSHTGEKLATFGSGVSDVRYSEGGSRVIARDERTNELVVWTLGGRQLFRLPADVEAVRFSPDDDVLICRSNRRLSRWTGDGRRQTTLPIHVGREEFPAFIDSRRVLSCYYGKVLLCDLFPSEALLLRGEGGPAGWVAWSATSDTLIASRGRSSTRLWRVSDGVSIQEVAGGLGALSPDGSLLLTSSSTHLTLWSRAGHELRRFSAEDQLTPSNSAQPGTPAARKSFSHGVLSPDGRLVLGFDGVDVAGLWTIEGALRAQFRVDGPPAFFGDGQFILAGTRVHDLDGRVRHELNGKVRGIAHDGRRVLVESKRGIWIGSTDGSVVRMLATYPEPNEAGGGLTDDELAALEALSGVTQQGAYAVAVGRGGSAFLRDWSRLTFWSGTGANAFSLQGHAEEVSCSMFSPDGLTVVTGSEDATTRLWSSEGAPLSRMGGHEGTVTLAAFSPDGRYLATVSADGDVRVWYTRAEDLSRVADQRLEAARIEFTSSQRLRYAPLLGGR